MAEIFIGNIKGPQGIQGEKGEPGSGLKVLDYYTTFDDLTADITNPSVGDAYGVGSEHPYDIYIYSANKGWVNNGALAPDINEQSPNYAEATTLESLASGEKISLAFGKIKRAIKELISHLGNKSNPHEVTKAQVGLENVDNTSDADKPVSTAQSTAIAAAKKEGTNAQKNLNSHLSDFEIHITDEERSRWNNATGGGEPFVVTLVYDSDIGELISDCTAVEIYEAYQNWKVVYAEREGQVFRLNEITPEFAGFGTVITVFDNGAPISMTGQIFIDENGAASEYWSDLTKRSSSYEGNGTTSTRNISVGNTGNALLLYTEDCMYNSMFIVTESGAFGMYNMETVGIAKNEINFKNGLLTLATNSNYVNQNGITYKYQVL